MGAKPSTPRTVQLENDTPIGVIDVSDDVVQRLKGLHSAARKKAKEEDLDAGSQPSSHSNAPQAPAIVYYGEPTITSIEVRRQKEEELRNNDLYWARRLQQQEESLKKTNFLMENEYKNTINEVRKRFENSPAHTKVSACKDLKTKIIECYKANANQTLNCSSLVADFENCVQEQRSKVLSEKNQPAAKAPTPAVSETLKNASSVVTNSATKQ